MEILPITNQFSVGFNSEKASSNPDGGGGWSRETALAARLEHELRAAKGASALASAELLLPARLLVRAAAQALALAEGEPCGARGAAIAVTVAGQPLAAFKLDPATLTTHEIHIHLEHDAHSWTSMLPQFLKNLAGGGTIIISPQFTISKKKLFRSQDK